MSLPNAFVTLLTTPAYLPGALVLLHSLLTLHPEPRDFKIVCLVTPETVDAKTIGELRKAGFDLVIGVEPIGSGIPGQDALTLMGRPDLNLALTKLHLFRLSSVFSTLIYLDADVLPLRPLSHLFESTKPHTLSACSDTGWPDCFNSGVMVIRPRDSDWEGMREMLKNGEGDDGVYNSNGSFDGADQGLLNEWFSEEGGGGDWNKLPFTYNVTPTAAYQYAPAYKRYGHKINAVHFIGPNKPWSNLQWRPAGVSEPQNKDVAFDYPSLIDRWYAVYDKFVRPTAAHAPDISKRFAVPETVAVWNQSASAVPQQPDDRMDLDALRVAAQLGVTSFARGQYTSLPLEGRVDLLMPKPKPKVVHFESPPKSPRDAAPAIDSPTAIVAPEPQTMQQQTEQPSTWDASRYSPPKDAGPEMSIPMNTFYQPAWEQPAAQQSAWYHAPPPQREPEYPTLPANVQKDEWYKQFTGSQPDRTAIQPVFPWEQPGQAYRKPDRVFPRGSSPPRHADRDRKPQLTVSIQQPTPPVQSPAQRPSPPPPPPPPRSMAEAMASYTNAWDNDPSIKQYIDRITGKPSGQSRPAVSRDMHGRDMSGLQSVPGTPRKGTAPALHRRDPSNDTQSSASGDGDDEDEGETDDDPGASPRLESTPGIPSSQPFPRGQYSSNPRYRDRHVQTDRAQMSDATVQAAPGGGPSPAVRTFDLPRVPVGAAPRRTDHSIQSGGNGNGTYRMGGNGGNGDHAVSQTLRTSSSSETTRASNLATPPSDGVSTGGRTAVAFPQAPYHGGSHSHGHSHSHSHGHIQQPSFTKAFSSNFGGALAAAGVGEKRQSSSFSASGGSVSYGVGGAVGAVGSVGAGGVGGLDTSRQHKPSRTWDPSTDVDVRKRDTQEVLSRFMKAGSFARSG